MQDFFLDLLKIVLPSGLVFATAFYLVKKFLDNERQKQLLELRSANQATIAPIRLQAFERVALYLERINPSNLIMRLHKPNMNSKQLHTEMIKTIRTEYEHNLSQQIYMTQLSWDQVKMAKEEVIRMINMAATRVSEDASAIDLGQQVLQACSQLNHMPTDIALETLKKELERRF